MSRLFDGFQMESANFKVEKMSQKNIFVAGLDEFLNYRVQ